MPSSTDCCGNVDEDSAGAVARVLVGLLERRRRRFRVQVAALTQERVDRPLDVADREHVTAEYAELGHVESVRSSCTRHRTQ